MTRIHYSRNKKIDEALEIVLALGMPRGQQNERSALTMLALLDLKSSGKWIDLNGDYVEKCQNRLVNSILVG